VEHAQHLDRPVAGLGGAGGPRGQHGVDGGGGVDGVALAVPAAGGPVRAVDLDDGDVVPAQVAGQRGAVGTGALHPRAMEGTVAACPAQQVAVAGRGGRERGGGYQHAEHRDHRCDVGVLVGVDTEDDVLTGRVALAVHAGLRHAGHRWFVS
jgi:hypothetical protein